MADRFSNREYKKRSASAIRQRSKVGDQRRISPFTNSEDSHSDTAQVEAQVHLPEPIMPQPQFEDQQPDGMFEPQVFENQVFPGPPGPPPELPQGPQQAGTPPNEGIQDKRRKIEPDPDLILPASDSESDDPIAYTPRERNLLQRQALLAQREEKTQQEWEQIQMLLHNLQIRESSLQEQERQFRSN